MAISSELPVYIDTLNYIQRVIELQKLLPKDIKHSIGQEWLKRAINLPTYIIKANMFRSEREAYLTDFICEFENCKIVALLADSNKWISKRQLSSLMYLEALIGKQVTAWKKASNSTYKKRKGAANTQTQ